jgi:LysM repeat protein
MRGRSGDVASSIGIKIANGEFYPILSESKAAKRRMVLTTVHDGQKSVQIDLYRSETRTMTDAQYLGTLVVEKLKTRKKGEPSVELVVSQDTEGEISAEAKDLDNPKAVEHARLSISLSSLHKDSAEEIDFPDLASGTEERRADSALGFGAENAGRRRGMGKKFPLIPLIIIAILVLAGAGFCIWRFVLSPPASPSKNALQGIETHEDHELETPLAVPPPDLPSAAPELPSTPPVAEAAPVEEKAPVREEAPPPVISAEPKTPPPAPAPPVSRARPKAPVQSYKVPATIPAGGVAYKIRWGDTLWDISQAFYRNPWRYKYLARYNGIRNPNRIISGTSIRIPPR